MDKPKSFWTSVPGILMGSAALLTAIGTFVGITLNLFNQPDTVEMPNVVGLEVSVAKRALDINDLEQVSIEYALANFQDPDIVLKQSPPSGTTVPIDVAVKLVVSMKENEKSTATAQVPRPAKVETPPKFIKDDKVTGQKKYVETLVSPMRVERRVSLRSVGQKVTVEELKAMVVSKNFYVGNINKKQFEDATDWMINRAVRDNYESKYINGDGVVIHKDTGLMWQKAGSCRTGKVDCRKTYMTYDEALAWLNKLNSEGYAGYRDWRFPTTEEAASIMEWRGKARGFIRYLNSTFNAGADTIWTSDWLSEENRWIAYLASARIQYINKLPILTDMSGKPFQKRIQARAVRSLF